MTSLSCRPSLILLVVRGNVKLQLVLMMNRRDTLVIIFGEILSVMQVVESIQTSGMQWCLDPSHYCTLDTTEERSGFDSWWTVQRAHLETERVTVISHL